jgi:hypothetical protein
LSNQSKNEFSNQLNNELEKELKKEPAGNLLASIATRIILTPSILGLTALLGHNYITGPLPWNAMTNFGMGLIEVGSFTIVGFVLSLFSVFQYLLVDRLFLDNAIRKTIRALMSDEQDSNAGAGLENTVRKLVTQLREAPGVEGFLFRFVLDVSGVFSEPGIARLIEDVTKRDGGDAVKTKLSTLLASAVEGSLIGRLDELRIVTLLGLVAWVFGADVLLLFIDSIGR